MDADEVLGQLTIPTPCSMDWNRMSGDDRTRFCEACGKHVYNLIAMGPEETASLLSGVRERGERRCVRLYRRPDGTLTSSRCQPKFDLAARPWQFTIRSIMAVIAGMAAFLGLAKWLSPEDKPPRNPPAAGAQVTTGDLY